MKKIIRSAAIVLLALAAVLGCKKQESGSQPRTQQRWLRIYYDGVFKDSINVTGWKKGEDFVEFRRYSYPWRGEKKISYRINNGFLMVKGKGIIGVDLTVTELIDIANPNRIITAITDREHLFELNLFPNLVALEVKDPLVTDRDLVCLSGLVKLRKLDLGITGVTAAGLSNLKGLANLRELSLPISADSEEWQKALPLCEIYLVTCLPASLPPKAKQIIK